VTTSRASTAASPESILRTQEQSSYFGQLVLADCSSSERFLNFMLLLVLYDIVVNEISPYLLINMTC